MLEKVVIMANSRIQSQSTQLTCFIFIIVTLFCLATEAANVPPIAQLDEHQQTTTAVANEWQRLPETQHHNNVVDGSMDTTAYDEQSQYDPLVQSMGEFNNDVMWGNGNQFEKRGPLYQRSSRPKTSKIVRKYSVAPTLSQAAEHYGPLPPKYLQTELSGISPVRTGELVKILQRIAARKGILLSNKTLRYGISK